MRAASKVQIKNERCKFRPKAKKATLSNVGIHHARVGASTIETPWLEGKGKTGICNHVASGKGGKKEKPGGRAGLHLYR